MYARLSYFTQVLPAMTLFKLEVLEQDSGACGWQPALECVQLTGEEQVSTYRVRGKRAREEEDEASKDVSALSDSALPCL